MEKVIDVYTPESVLRGDNPMRRKLRGVLTLVFGLVCTAAPAFAHHGFSVEYDAKKCTDMTGTLTGVDWQNPHVHFTMDVKGADGKVSSWTVEVNSVPAMKRSAGIQRQDFLDNVGKTISIRGCPTKAGGTANRASAETLKLSDGVAHIVGQDVEGLGLNKGSGPQ
jgi:hypothetical protein